MRAQGDPGRWLTKTYDASEALSPEDIKGFGRLVITTSGVGLRMPDPTADLGDNSWEGIAVNPTTGLAFLLMKGGFNGGRDTVVIPPGRSVRFQYGLAETGYQCDVDLVSGEVAKTYTATLAWTTGVPDDASGALTTASIHYSLHDGICEGEVAIVATDGNGATNLTIPLPPHVPCMNADMDIPVAGYKVIDGAVTECHAYIDSSQAALEDRIIKLRTPGTWTNNKPCSIHLKFWYPVYGFSTWSPTKVWGTEDPEAQTVVALYKLVEGVGDSLSCYGLFQTLAADGNTSSSLTATLPIPVPDNNIYFEAISLQKVNTTWYNPKANVDGLSNTNATRLLIFDDFTAHTNTNAHQESVAFIYEVAGWEAFTPHLTMTIGTATPLTIVKVGRFAVIGSQCLVGAYGTFSDGKGLTNLAVDAPVPPRYSAYDVPLNAKELSDAAKSNPVAYLDAAQDDPFSRLIRFKSFATIAGTKAGNWKVAGSYRIN